MSVTPRIAAPVLEPGQAIPETTVNEITRYLEAVAAGVVVDKDLTAPAGTESDGDCYIIPASATGAWAGQDDSFAVKISTGWVFIPPFEGMAFYVQDEAADYRYVSGAWGVDSPAGLGTASTLDFDTDGTLAANSDAKLATQKAVRTYIAAAVAGLLDYKGATDCSANPNYPAASKGDAYVVSVAGKIGGASGQSVEAGDFFFAKADNAGGTDASVGSSWDILQFNALAYALLSGATFTGAVHVPDDAYDATGWNGSTEVPTKNAVRDKIEAIVAGVTSVDNDTTLASDSTVNPPSVHAVRGYVATAVTGLLDFKGSTDCSANPNYPAALKGDAYVVSVAGKIGGASGTSVDVGDVYVASADNAGGTQASVGASWFVLEHNLAGALLAANNLSEVASASTARTNIGAAARTPQIQSVASASTVTPTFADDQVIVTAQAAGLTLANPTGTALDGWGLVIRIKDNGTARSISYGTQYRALGVTLPTTTVISKTLYLGLIFNNADTKWDVVAVAQEA